MARFVTVLMKFFVLEVIALAGVVAFITLSTTLPDPWPQILASLVLIWLAGALAWRLVAVIRDPEKAVRWRK